jgi:hypothetical protein
MFKTLRWCVACLCFLPAAFAGGARSCKEAMQGRFALDLSAVTAERQNHPGASQIIELSEREGTWKGLASDQGQREAFKATLYHHDSRHPSEDLHTRKAGEELLPLAGTQDVCWMEFDLGEKYSGSLFLLRTDFSKRPVEQLEAFIAGDGARCGWQMDAARLRKVQYLLVETKMYGVHFSPMVKLP